MLVMMWLQGLCCLIACEEKDMETKKDENLKLEEPIESKGASEMAICIKDYIENYLSILNLTEEEINSFSSYLTQLRISLSSALYRSITNRSITICDSTQDNGDSSCNMGVSSHEV